MLAMWNRNWFSKTVYVSEKIINFSMHILNIVSCLLDKNKLLPSGKYLLCSQDAAIDEINQTPC